MEKVNKELLEACKEYEETLVTLMESLGDGEVNGGLAFKIVATREKAKKAISKAEGVG